MKYVCEVLSEEACQRSFHLLNIKVNDSSKRICQVITWGTSNKPVGIIDAKAKETGDWVEIGAMVLPAFQGRGVARESHELLFLKLKCLNWPQHYKAFCHHNNEAANHLYQRLGFVEVPINKNYKSFETRAWERG